MIKNFCDIIGRYIFGFETNFACTVRGCGKESTNSNVRCEIYLMFMGTKL